MYLITPLGKQPNIDLSKIPGVSGIYCAVNDEITIHLSCKEGDEQLVFDNLPKWIHDNMKVIKSASHIFLKYKKKRK